MRIMGIDYGDSRIGIALSDELGWMAHGLQTLNWNGSMAKSVRTIGEIVRERKVDKIVVGFPKNMNGTIGPRGEKTIEFIGLLKQEVDIEIIEWDERLSTVAANRTMHELGVKTSRKKQVVDQIAATYILQGYLDSCRNRL